MILTAEQQDILTELINIGVGRASGMLNEMLQSHVDLQSPLHSGCASGIDPARVNETQSRE